ncbi:uncharacterized protein LOC118219426 isoform X1 [Anguilla anguilla]|uniref:uncharacterized protein LOC118219426 isoform X1 n=1 Tax=Anguilla anguilla TaxID=7936 RepID=UPI0015AF6DBE|nr:uncharacterized protein LOC118219426 isoform X1 [Anguilla anguilla]
MKSSPGLNVFWMMWKRVLSEAPLPAPSLFSVGRGSGKRFESGWDRSSMEVWLLVKSVQVADGGRYACLVLTNRGYAERSVSLKVIARHSEPRVWSVPERNIEEDAEVTMFCRALGGFPRGAVRWFDQYATNWTRSARTDAREREDGRFDLTSEFRVRRVSSASPGYRCCVIGGDGDKEGEAEIHLAFREPEKRVQRWSNNSIVAVIVVAGSLITGLLLLALLQRRRPRQQHGRQEMGPSVMLMGIPSEAELICVIMRYIWKKRTSKIRKKVLNKKKRRRPLVRPLIKTTTTVRRLQFSVCPITKASMVMR